MKRLLLKILNKFRGEVSTEKLISHGMIIGKNFTRLQGCSLDISHCWLIEIGDNVTMAPEVRLIAHDASTKNDLNYTLIGKIKIGNDVFLGARSIVLPNVTIGNNVVIGAGTIVTKDIPNNCVAAGSPARIIGTYSNYIEKRKLLMETCPVFSEKYTVRGGISNIDKQKMREALDNTIGFVI